MIQLWSSMQEYNTLHNLFASSSLSGAVYNKYMSCETKKRVLQRNIIGEGTESILGKNEKKQENKCSRF